MYGIGINKMTKTEIFDFLQQFDGINRAKLTLQNSISTYNHNFYTVPRDVCDAPFEFLLYGESDDEDYTAWYLCDKNQNIICGFGESYCLYPDEIIVVYEDINYFDWYDVKILINM